MRRYLTRFESAVTRFFLLGIFVVGLTAQFVTPLGEALQGKAFLGGALLSLVAYVLYDAVKDLAASLRLPERSQGSVRGGLRHHRARHWPVAGNHSSVRGG
ncbi:hypothetical protein ACFXKC_51905 [Streptomyces sp. NPDC059340]|uniref:hypothetical protein n=1 Tax=Streptomyces sp. NPDC059340 TaxID=3346806 RepID=UPI0036A33608